MRPILGRADSLYAVRWLIQGVGVKSELLGSSKGAVITDVIIPVNHSVSRPFGGRSWPEDTAANFQGLSLGDNPRDSLIYNAGSHPRWIKIRRGEIRYIRIQAQAVLKDGTQEDIELAPNSVMTIKLALVSID